METIRGRAPYLRNVADVMYRNTRSWNHGFLCFLFGNDLGTKIGGIQIAKNGVEDFIVWKNSNSGQFSVKGAYWAAQVGRFNDTNRLWGWIWKSSIHPRLSMMLWRVCANVLPTANIFNSAACKCLFCDSSPENHFHLFVECPFALALWFSSPFPVRLNLATAGSIPELLCKLCEGVNGVLRGQMLGCFAIIFETIWNIRFRIVHQGEAAWSIDQARRAITNRFQELITANLKTVQSSITPPPSVPDESLKILLKNLVVVDGSYSDGCFGCAVVFMFRVRIWILGIANSILNLSICRQDLIEFVFRFDRVGKTGFW
ncbi:hypothetical protein F8388_019607 [Cannabis sativa]|uniref:Reverse transcriptase zinc-binding domain-containing protein n=1 Tax=Cannabis sativa TaxID=3483 RepID=A0A7J6DU84_CANSA|nr:hypothetical protein F8388_019607 [Cannabis sativa]